MLTSYITGKRKKEVDRMEREGKQTLEKYVKEQGKEVNWKKLIKDHHTFIEKASEGINDKIYNNILRYLEIKGILSFSTKNKFFIYSRGMNLNPQANSGIFYYFKREADAEEFRKYEYGNAIYETEIFHNQS